VIARRAKREKGGLGEDPPGSTMTRRQVRRTCMSCFSGAKTLSTFDSHCIAWYFIIHFLCHGGLSSTLLEYALREQNTKARHGLSEVSHAGGLGAGQAVRTPCGSVR
jgi:hypothetical protein